MCFILKRKNSDNADSALKGLNKEDYNISPAFSKPGLIFDVGILAADTRISLPSKASPHTPYIQVYHKLDPKRHS